MGLASSRALAVIAASVSVVAVVACAKGDAARQFVDETQPTQPSESPPPSQKVPPPGSSSGVGDDDSGASSSGSSGSSGSPGSSGSSSSGSSSSGGTDAGGTDAGVDAADAAPDSSVADAGASCATAPPSNACGLSPQCGCAVNATCDVTNGTTGAVSCVLAGGGPQGSYCTATTQCAKGLTCGYNICRPYCPAIGAACAGAGLGQCAQYYDPTAGTPVTNGKVCTLSCDLRAPSAACGSNNCIWDTTISATDCDKSGAKGAFAACTRYNDCQQGMACVNHPVFGFECERWCRIGASDCGIFETCKDVYGAAAPTSGASKLGHCQ